MLNRNRLTAAAAIIGALAIAGPVAGGHAAPTPHPVQGAYAAGLAAAQSGWQQGAAAAQSGWQQGATALQGAFGTAQLGFPGIVNLGPTGPLGPLGADG